MSSLSTERSWSTGQLAWGCIGSLVVGAILLYGAGFHWLGQWQTGEQAEKQLATAACVEEFLLQPNRGVVYAELKGNRSAYQRQRLLEKNKWAPSRAVAQLCDQRILEMDATHFELPVEAPDETAEAKQPA